MSGSCATRALLTPAPGARLPHWLVCASRRGHGRHAGDAALRRHAVAGRPIWRWCASTARASTAVIDWNKSPDPPSGSGQDLNFDGVIGPLNAGYNDWANHPLESARQPAQRRQAGTGCPNPAARRLRRPSSARCLWTWDIGDLGSGDLSRSDLGPAASRPGRPQRGDLGRGDLGRGDFGNRDFDIGLWQSRLRKSATSE